MLTQLNGTICGAHYYPRSFFSLYLLDRQQVDVNLMTEKFMTLVHQEWVPGTRRTLTLKTCLQQADHHKGWFKKIQRLHHV